MADHDIIQLEVLPDFRLNLAFANGHKGVFDIRKHVRFDGIAEQLNDPDYFAQVIIDPECKTLCWPNGFDLCPDCIYHWATGIPFPDYVLEYERKREKEPATV